MARPTAAPDATAGAVSGAGAAAGPVSEPGRERSGSHTGSGFEPGQHPRAAARTAPSAASAARPLAHGDVVIAAITSCTHTSNPSVMVAAGLLARNAVARGLTAKPWVKTSLAPGSRIVTDYLVAAGLQGALDALGFHTVGYGCTTCMGNSGPLDEAVARQIEERSLATAAVLSGNRNFEGRIHPLARANYLASPPLVVAYALAGSLLVDLATEPLGTASDGAPVHLRDIWPKEAEIEEVVARTVTRELFVGRYGGEFAGAEQWSRLPAAPGELFAWPAASEYIKRPPFFAVQTRHRGSPGDIPGARALLMLGDSVTTDHISPIGAIPADSPAGRYLIAHGVAPRDFNSYGARRINHEVMVRGTFANPQVRNELVPGVDGGFTRHLPDGATMSVYDAAMKYAAEGVPCVVIAGAEYGFGSARDWAAKGTLLLGVRAVIAEGFERIHRANLVGMGVLPLEFARGTTRRTLGLTGEETYTLAGLADLSPGMEIPCTIGRADGSAMTIPLRVRIDTAVEADWYRHGGVLNYVLLQLVEAGAAPAPSG
jgi:aconitate hydratase